ncbi:hypothetical protein [Acidithiobacillus ferriphilus]|uniref:hypothetical protein n=1 Tax=Acidithiobacillus ferriphilus TaxID=1689834 RepID=UPI002DBD9063|nr:hypothetical protein [Acidithiobacillus ferriphilus]MEB8557984.1 hypothetical protein [Acidithiobacillus ferriphilus]
MNTLLAIRTIQWVAQPAAGTDGYPLHPWCRRLSAGVTGDHEVTSERGHPRRRFGVAGDARTWSPETPKE